MNWHKIETAPPPKDRLFLCYGTIGSHPGLEMSSNGKARVVAYWDEIDEAFCTQPGDWLGPFVEPSAWAELPAPPEDT